MLGRISILLVWIAIGAGLVPNPAAAEITPVKEGKDSKCQIVIRPTYHWGLDPNDLEFAPATMSDWTVTLRSAVSPLPKELELGIGHADNCHKRDQFNTLMYSSLGTFTATSRAAGGIVIQHPANADTHGDVVSWSVRPSTAAPGNLFIAVKATHTTNKKTSSTASWSYRASALGELFVWGSYPLGDDILIFNGTTRRNRKRKGEIPKAPEVKNAEGEVIQPEQSATDWRTQFAFNPTSDMTLAFVVGAPGTFTKLELGVATETFTNEGEYAVPALFDAAPGSTEIYIAVDLVQWLSFPTPYVDDDTFTVTAGSSPDLPGFVFSTTPIPFTAADAYLAPAPFTGTVTVSGELGSVAGQFPSVDDDPIDHFDIGAIQIFESTVGTTFEFENDPSALGGQREVLAEVTASPSEESIFISTQNGLYAHEHADGVKGSSTVTWDGTDAAPGVPGQGDLNLDLTAAGHNAFEIAIDEFFSFGGDPLDVGVGIAVTLPDGTTQVEAAFRQTAEIEGMKLVLPDHQFSGADMTDIAAVALTVDGETTSDFRLAIDSVSRVAAPGWPPVIDSFEDSVFGLSQDLVATNFGFENAPLTPGGQREVHLEVVANTGSDTLDVSGDGSNFYWVQGPDVFGRGKLVWDGPDGSAALGSTAISGFDLSVGAWNAFALRLDSVDFFNVLGTGLTLELFLQPPGAVPLLSQSVSVADYIDKPERIFFPFEDFTPGPAPALSQVAALGLEVISETQDDYQMILGDLRAVRLGVCGDADADSVIDEHDIDAIRASIADLSGAALSTEGAERCSVIGGASDCDILDVVVLTRLLAVPTLSPGIAEVCTASAGP